MSSDWHKGVYIILFSILCSAITRVAIIFYNIDNNEEEIDKLDIVLKQ